MTIENQQFVRTSLVLMIATEDGGAVVLDLGHDEFLGLSKVAREMWELLVLGQTPLEIVEVLATSYEVGPERLLSDLLHFTRAMEERGLLVRSVERRQAQLTSTITTAMVLEWQKCDCFDALPNEVKQISVWQNPEWQEAFVLLQRVDELLRQVGLLQFSYALASLPVHKTVTVENEEVQRLADAVMKVADWQPCRPACLHQYLALVWMLRRRAMFADVVIGVYTYPFSAHVWMESGGQIVQWRAGMGYYADFR